MKPRMPRKIIKSDTTHFDNLETKNVDTGETALVNGQIPGDLSIDDADYPQDLHNRIFAGVDDGLPIEEDELLVDDLPLFDDEETLTEDPVIDAGKKTVKSELSKTDTMPKDVKPQEKVEIEKALDETTDENNSTLSEQHAAASVKAEEKKDAEDTSLENNQKPGELEVKTDDDKVSASTFNLIDLDKVADNAVGSLAFASFGTTKLALCNARVIASMDEDDAHEVGADDVYMTDEYDEACGAECEAKGIRAGLRSMGYKFATVQLAQSAQVKAEVSRQTASARQLYKDKLSARKESMAQCLSLAAVGLNRNAFKNHDNALRSELVQSLEIAGVRNPARLVRAAFEKAGVEYAKTILAVADELSELPEENRDALATQFDMTVEPEEVAENEGMSGDDLGDANEFGDSVDGCDEMPMTVESALRKPLKAANNRASGAEIFERPELPFVHI